MTKLSNKNEILKLFNINIQTFNKWKQSGLPNIEKDNKVLFDQNQVQNWHDDIRQPIHDLKIGKVYNNTTISKVFQCSEQGGMRRSHLTNTLVLFSDHTKGIYEDKTVMDDDGNELLLYTGMGQEGDQDINFGQNKTLNNSNDLSIKVFMFEAFRSGEHIFRGEVKLTLSPYSTDQYGRKVWIFPLAYMDSDYYISEKLSQEKDRRQEQAANKLTDEELYNRAKQVEKIGQRKAVTKVYIRNPHVTSHVKRRANGYCDLCGNHAPFNDRNGKAYLECHHVDWLALGGKDSIDNAVALDPSCHRKMHELNLKHDIDKLKEKIVFYKNRGL